MAAAAGEGSVGARQTCAAFVESGVSFAAAPSARHATALQGAFRSFSSAALSVGEAPCAPASAASAAQPLRRTPGCGLASMATTAGATAAAALSSPYPPWRCLLQEGRGVREGGLSGDSGGRGARRRGVCGGSRCGRGRGGFWGSSARTCDMHWCTTPCAARCSVSGEGEGASIGAARGRARGGVALYC